MQTSDKDVQRAQIADRLRQSREYVGLSQEEVSTALGISRPAVTNIEAGQRKVEATELVSLSRLYHRTVEYLLTGKDPVTDTPQQLAFLARAIKGLSAKDMDELERFAEFLKNSPKSSPRK